MFIPCKPTLSLYLFDAPQLLVTGSLFFNLVDAMMPLFDSSGIVLPPSTLYPEIVGARTDNPQAMDGYVVSQYLAKYLTKYTSSHGSNVLRTSAIMSPSNNEVYYSTNAIHAVQYCRWLLVHPTMPWPFNRHPYSATGMNSMGDTNGHLYGATARYSRDGTKHTVMHHVCNGSCLLEDDSCSSQLD